MSDQLSADELAGLDARWAAWYQDDEAHGDADWPGRDAYEGISHYIVRQDWPRLRAEVERLQAQLAAAQVLADRWAIEPGTVVTTRMWAELMRALGRHAELNG